MSETKLPEIEGIKYLRSRSDKVINGICFETCEIEMKDVKKLIVPFSRCVFEPSRDKKTTKMIVFINKVQNYWGFPASLSSIVDSRERMGIGTRKGPDDTFHLSSFGSWVGGHEGGCSVLFKIVFPSHIEKISRRDEYYGGRICLDGFEPIKSWIVDKAYTEIKFDKNQLTPSDICYEKVEFMFSLEPFYPEIQNAKGGGVICTMFSFLSVEDLLISIPLVSKTFNLASKFVLLHQKNFSRNEYLYMMSYDYSGKTGLNEDELFQICKNNKNYDFGVSVPYAPRKGEMDTLSYYFHKRFKNEEFMDLLIEKCGGSGYYCSLALNIYLGHYGSPSIEVAEKLLKNPELDPSGKSFLYACMGKDKRIIEAMLNHPGFYTDKERERGGFDLSQTVEYLVSSDNLPMLLKFQKKTKEMRSVDVLDENNGESLAGIMATAVREGALESVKYLVTKFGIKPTPESITRSFEKPNIEIYKFVLSDPEFDPSPCLSALFQLGESIAPEVKEEMKKLFLNHPKVSNGSLLSAYAKLGNHEKFMELLPKCSVEEKGQALISGCTRNPVFSVKMIDVLLHCDGDESKRTELDFHGFINKIITPDKESGAFWYEGMKFVGNNEIIKKVLRTPGVKCDDLVNEEFVKKLVDTCNLELLNFFLWDEKKIEMTVDLLQKVVEHLYHDKEGITKFFIENFDKIDLDTINDETAYMLFQNCYEEEIRGYLLNNVQFMKKMRDPRLFEGFAEKLEDLKEILEKVDMVPTEQTVASFCGRNAAARGLDVLKYIVETFKLKIHMNNNEPLRNAMRWGRGEVVRYLMTTDPKNVDPSVNNHQLLHDLLSDKFWAKQDCETITKLFVGDSRFDPTVDDIQVLKDSVRVSFDCFKMIWDHPKVRKMLNMKIVNEVLFECSKLSGKRDSVGRDIIKVILDDDPIVEIEKVDDQFLCDCVRTKVVECIQYIVVEKKVKVTKEAILLAEELNKTEILDILMKNRRN